MSELTFGEKAVGLSFNPSGSDDVLATKELCAELLNLLSEIKHKSTDAPSWEKNVFFTAAFNAVVAAQMAVVKYITWKDEA